VADNAGGLLRILHQFVLVTSMVLALRASFIYNHCLGIRHAAMELCDAGPPVSVDRPFHPAAKGAQSK
jgi:hypothetical protein